MDNPNIMAKAEMASRLLDPNKWIEEWGLPPLPDEGDDGIIEGAMGCWIDI